MTDIIKSGLKFNVGDRVRVVDDADDHRGETGEVARVDLSDEHLPFRVTLDKAPADDKWHWFRSCELVAEQPADECDTDEPESDEYLVFVGECDEAPPMTFGTYKAAYDSAEALAEVHAENTRVYKLVAEFDPTIIVATKTYS